MLTYEFHNLRNIFQTFNLIGWCFKELRLDFCNSEYFTLVRVGFIGWGRVYPPHPTPTPLHDDPLSKTRWYKLEIWIWHISKDIYVISENTPYSARLLNFAEEYPFYITCLIWGQIGDLNRGEPLFVLLLSIEELNRSFTIFIVDIIAL